MSTPSACASASLRELKANLAFAADCAAKIAQLAACPSMEARALSADLLVDLRAYRLAEIVPLNRDQVAALQAVRKAEADAASDRIKRIGPLLWAELHKRALSPVQDTEAETAWLTAFFRRLPCGACKAKADQHLKALPPNFEHYFSWTVEFHNLVNGELGKPEISTLAARDIWQTKPAASAV